MVDGSAVAGEARRPPRVSLIGNPLVRSIAFQALVAVAVAGTIYWFAENTISNLRRLNIASGFGFLWSRAGFDIGETLISYTQDSTYGRALLVGLLNTLLVAILGIILASILGFLLGVMRLSRNWLLARIAAVYVETVRNIPVLLQLLFWYKAVLSVLPNPRQGYVLSAIDPLGPFLWVLRQLGFQTGDSFLTFSVPTVALNNRGLMLPVPVPGPTFGLTAAALAIGVLLVIGLGVWAHARKLRTGRDFPIVWISVALIVGLPLIAFVATGAPLTFNSPVLKGFNFTGGTVVRPEFTALLLGLTLYTATYIGEIVRAGIVAVPHGQTEAAYALGLRRGLTLRRVIIPQAMRVIVPPLTSQYLNLTKNSSLAVAVGYPDLVSVFAGTVLNQTGQAVEVIFITMLVYLAISLSTSVFMNWFNRRVALVER